MGSAALGRKGGGFGADSRWWGRAVVQFQVCRVSVAHVTPLSVGVSGINGSWVLSNGVTGGGGD